MPGSKGEHVESDSKHLKGTTLSVYRFLFRKAVPLGTREIQEGLGFSSPSVAHYHLQKLLAAGLVEELPTGYVVHRMVFSGLIRIKRIVIPVQATLVAFFSAAIILMLTVLRPPVLYSGYAFGLAAIIVALGASISEVIRVLHEP
jgi:Helix-turn-helix domain